MRLRSRGDAGVVGGRIRHRLDELRADREQSHRHSRGSRGHRITIVFKADLDLDALFVALVAFGVQEWLADVRYTKIVRESCVGY